METGYPADDSVQPLSGGQRLTPLLVHLLKGILYRDTHTQLWQLLYDLEAPLRDQLAILGLELYLDEEEGFAFLQQRVANEDEPEIPRLVARRSLSYPVSLLCVLLRKRLAEADHQGGDLKLVVSRSEIHNDMKVFFAELNNEARLADQLDSHIEKVVKLGFLKRMKEADHFEVRRILKALVDGDWLADLDEKLVLYLEHGQSLA
ncbi:DUF4194 domain-containing protein [Marinobacterium aestuariivivens]|uniref:DUF4194 domain-containing protein n=1 Tax=Marinobacterium aestuariivivens TaxID=1698799 RepID=A0ABW2AA43_9GAMM